MAMRNHEQRTRNEHGIVLMLSLLLIAALTAAGIGASVIIVTEFRATSSTDQGIKAFYTADIGMERALYTIFNNRLVGTQLHLPAFGTCVCASSTETVCQLSCNDPAFSGTTALIDAGSSVSLQDTSVETASKKFSLIRKNQTVQIDLYDPNEPFGFSSPPRTITLQRSALTTELGTDVGAEVQWVYALADGQTFTENSTIKLLSNENLASATGATINLLTGNISGNDNTINPPGITLPPTSFSNISGWVVRIKALNNDLPNLTFFATCVDTNPCPYDGYANRFQLKSDIAISSQGTYRDASFVLSGAVPWRLPTVGVFDYVIFSEKTLDKPG